MEIKLQKGDVVICAVAGDYGKPRPAVIVQSDLFNSTHASITVCPVTTHLVNAPLFRINISPTKYNGLQKSSQIMIDKIITLRRDKIRQKIGSLNSEQQANINQALKTWLNIK